jgi:microcystin-dependent protein
MSEPFIGEIRLLPYTFAPYGWLSCDGQLLNISQYQSLFAVIGVTYGGNGTTNFGVPDLRSRAAVDQGTGSGLTGRSMGQTGGASSVTLTNGQIPAHSHTAQGSSSTTIVGTSSNNMLANPGGRSKAYAAYNAGNVVNMSVAAIQSAGGSQAHENRQPYLVLQYCIATEGYFPVRP